MVQLTREVSLSEVQAAARACRLRNLDGWVTAVFGVPRGGLVPAAMVASLFDVPLLDSAEFAERWPGGVLVVDDLVDSGATLKRIAAEHDGVRVDALFRKSISPPDIAPRAWQMGDEWLVFPWEEVEAEAGPHDAVVRLLEFVGEDPNRSGLAETPGRVIRSLEELTRGYAVDVPGLFKTFDDACDEMVVVRGVDFTSLCEHHLLPFVGRATVAYVPAERVVGLSKLARVVDAFACRLQVQERMTVQIAEAIEENLAPKGVAVVVSAQHACMACRGVRKPGAEMVTSAMLGVFREKPEARAEFLALSQKAT